MNWYDFILRNRSEVFERSVEHIGLVGASMTIALAIGLPLGVALVRRLTLQRWVLGAANVVQTIPSLALFGFLIPVPWIGGVGASTAIVALSLYALLPILRNTCTGIAEVDAAVIESARGMGMTPQQVLWQVQLPLAAPVVLAGVRVATVISIGVTTIAAAIGAGGLGVFIFRGVAMVNNQVILAGAIPAALLAVAADLGLGLLQRSLAPREAQPHNIAHRQSVLSHAGFQGLKPISAGHSAAEAAIHEESYSWILTHDGYFIRFASDERLQGFSVNCATK